MNESDEQELREFRAVEAPLTWIEKSTPWLIFFVSGPGVGGSNPLSPTILSLDLSIAYAAFAAFAFSTVFGTFGTTEGNLQQMREAWPYAPAQRFLLFDHDTKFGKDVVSAVRTMGSQPVRTAFGSPWQNGVAERWVGSCRRDLLDHVIILNEHHLKRLISEYVRYYHEDRTHLGLAKDTPACRPTAIGSAIESKIRSFPRLGGLHHRYAVAA
jgi:putative transposase